MRRLHRNLLIYALLLPVLLLAPVVHVYAQVDTDGDGYADAFDTCPTQGAGFYGIDSFGCPLDNTLQVCTLLINSGLDCTDPDGDNLPVTYFPIFRFAHPSVPKSEIIPDSFSFSTQPTLVKLKIKNIAT